MAITATSSGRRLAMAVLLLLAVAGAVIRAFAPDPSTLRDIGTLLLVLWLPAIGNLVAYVIRRIPRRAPQGPALAFGPEFVPHLGVRLQPSGLVEDVPAAIAAAGNRCTLVVGQSGFSARLGKALDGLDETVTLELLRPAVALPQLPVGTDFHVLVGTTGVAKGQVVEHTQG